MTYLVTSSICIPKINIISCTYDINLYIPFLQKLHSIKIVVDGHSTNPPQAIQHQLFSPAPYSTPNDINYSSLTPQSYYVNYSW